MKQNQIKIGIVIIVILIIGIAIGGFFSYATALIPITSSGKSCTGVNCSLFVNPKGLSTIPCYAYRYTTWFKNSYDYQDCVVGLNESFPAAPQKALREEIPTTNGKLVKPFNN